MSSEMGGAARRPDFVQELTQTRLGMVVLALENPEVMDNPDYCAVALAAAQRSYLMGELDDKTYKTGRRAAEEVLVASGQWGRILERVKNGGLEVEPHELQLVLFSAQPARPELHIERPPVTGKVMGKVGLRKIAMFEDIPVDNTGNPQRALQGYVEGRHRLWYNHISPHLLAIGLTDVMRGFGLLSPENLDIARPNRAIRPLLEMLQGHIEAARRTDRVSGEAALPPEVGRTSSALEHFLDDARAYAAGHLALANLRGRRWHFLGEDGQKQYETYLHSRLQLRAYANQRLREATIASPQALNRELERCLAAAYAPPRRVIPGVQPPETEISPELAIEMVGALWGAVTLRQKDVLIRGIIKRHSNRVQQLLEPYVLDGLPLLAQKQAPQWLSVVTLNSWYDNDQQVSVFTPAYGSENDDYRAAGRAMSQNVMIRLGHNGTDSTYAYQPRAPQLGITVAYFQLADALRNPDTPPRMLVLLYDQFMDTVDGVDKKDYRRVFGTLPHAVKATINNPDSVRTPIRERAYRVRGGRSRLPA